MKVDELRVTLLPLLRPVVPRRRHCDKLRVWTSAKKPVAVGVVGGPAIVKPEKGRTADWRGSIKVRDKLDQSLGRAQSEMKRLAVGL